MFDSVVCKFWFIIVPWVLYVAKLVMMKRPVRPTDTWSSCTIEILSSSTWVMSAN